MIYLANSLVAEEAHSAAEVDNNSISTMEDLEEVDVAKEATSVEDNSLMKKMTLEVEVVISNKKLSIFSNKQMLIS